MRILASLLLGAVMMAGLSACSSSNNSPTPVQETDTGPVGPTDDPTDPFQQPDQPNLEPVASVRAAAVYLGDDLTLDGSASSDPDGGALSYQWQLVASPPGSVIFELASIDSNSYTFTPDELGDYTVRLTVTDPSGASSSVDITTSVTSRVDMLSYRPLDVEYSKALDRMILISEIPNQIHILDVETMQESTVALNLVPTAVSVSPDGLRAAVGHDGWVSYINLNDASLIDVIPVSTKAVDVVMAGNGYIYVFPETDQWESIYSINVDTKEQTTNGGYSIYAGTLAKLHPSGNYLYAADNGISPSDLEKISITNGTAEVLYDSPYHGDYDICGDLWLSEDGRRVFTKCGNVFRTTENRETDMTYNGSFSGMARVSHAAHSALANEVAVLPLPEWWDDNSDIGTTVRIYSYDFLGFERKVDIPKVIVGNNSYDTFGEYVYYDADGITKYVVFQVDSESALLNDYGIWEIPSQ